MGDLYGIVANVVNPDRVFRKGAKAWLAGGTGGEGYERFEFIAKSRGGRYVRKWTVTHRFANFRAAWVPEHLRADVWYFRGSREETEKRAKQLNEFADEWRAKIQARLTP